MGVLESVLPLISGFVPALLILIFIAYLGIFVDLARRSGIVITSRLRLILSTIIFPVIFLLSVIGVIYLATGENVVTNPLGSLSTIISQLFHGSFGVIAGIILIPIFVGALALYAINRNEAKFPNVLFLSTRLSIWPAIDAFWAFVFLFIFSLYYIPLIIMSVIAWALIPSIPPSVFFAVFGLIVAVILIVAGPTNFIGGIFFAIGYGALTSALLLFIMALASVLTVVGVFLTIFIIPLLIICLIVGAVMLVLGWLIASLGIVRVIGLAVIFLSVLAFYITNWLTNLFESLSAIPILSEILPTASGFIYWLINLLQILGSIGVVAGILMLIFGKREEVGQIHTISMGVTTAVISLIPLLLPQLFSIAVPSAIRIGELNLELLNTLLSLAFFSLILTKIPALVPFVYLFTMVLLRVLYGALTLISPPSAGIKKEQ